ncbi:hypothetical protein KVM33_01420 [Helicobacter pylori]|nr:hypothetical protein KVM33_06695 [Helicobacter pylori]WRB42066.1 hypothetical protein KVM33_01420 [Helicobacter pylori]
MFFSLAFYLISLLTHCFVCLGGLLGFGCFVQSFLGFRENEFDGKIKSKIIKIKPEAIK